MDASTAHTYTVILDILLLASALLAWYHRPRIGGQLAVGLQWIIVGVLVLGITHLADTIMKDTMIEMFDKALFPLLHRGLNVVGFLVIFVGFYRMKKAIEA